MIRHIIMYVENACIYLKYALVGRHFLNFLRNCRWIREFGIWIRSETDQIRKTGKNPSIICRIRESHCKRTKRGGISQDPVHGSEVYFPLIYLCKHMILQPGDKCGWPTNLLLPKGKTAGFSRFRYRKCICVIISVFFSQIGHLNCH